LSYSAAGAATTHAVSVASQSVRRSATSAHRSLKAKEKHEHPHALVAAMSASPCSAPTAAPSCAISRASALHRRLRAHHAGEGQIAEDPIVSAMAISVETFKGVVQLSGVAKTTAERLLAEQLLAKPRAWSACATISASRLKWARLFAGVRRRRRRRPALPAGVMLLAAAASHPSACRPTAKPAPRVSGSTRYSRAGHAARGCQRPCGGFRLGLDMRRMKTRAQVSDHRIFRLRSPRL